MKRVKRNSQDEIDEKDMLSRLTLDLKLEILMKLCAKDVAKFRFVSNLWSSIIRTKDFKDMYVARSSTRPRLLFAAYGKDTQFLHSCSQKDPSSDHHRVNITPPNPRYEFSRLVNGLICCQMDKTLKVGNPSTGQFINLPRVRTWRTQSSWYKTKEVVSFFGYEPVNDQYKILCMKVPPYDDRILSQDSQGKSEQHQVLSIGANQNWRMVKCNLRHIPLFIIGIKGTCEYGICINGVVCYLAYVNKICYVISFDLRFEKFNVTAKLPEDVLYYRRLVNHNGKVALGYSLDLNTLHLWVLEDAKKQEWSKNKFLIPDWIDIHVVGYRHFEFNFIGTLSTGEIILAPWAATDPFYVIYYDPKGNNVKQVVIEGIRGQFSEGQYSHTQVFLDHIESPIFLPNVR